MQLPKYAAILACTVSISVALTLLQTEHRFTVMHDNFVISGDVSVPAPVPPLRNRAEPGSAIEKRDWLPRYTFDDSNLAVRFRIQAYLMTGAAMENLLVAAFDSVTTTLAQHGNPFVPGGRWTIVNGGYQFAVATVNSHVISYSEILNVVCAIGVALVHGPNGDLPFENSFSVMHGNTEVASGQIVRVRGG